jgi:hypothetical protein
VDDPRVSEGPWLQEIFVWRRLLHRRLHPCFRAASFLLLSRSGSLSGVCASFLSLPTLLKSKAVPGVFGVLVAEAPKEANAPFPRANAEEPVAVVGEDTAEFEMWPMG